MIDALKEAEKHLPELLLQPERWKSLDVNYFPPRVERLWTQYNEKYRLFVHLIHPTDQPCLLHKHKWEAAFKMVAGSYDMSIAYCEDEITSEEAYELPVVASMEFHKGSYYEMAHTNSMHFVRPRKYPSLSLMLTGNLYPEPRVEAKHDGLLPLTEERKLALMKSTREIIMNPNAYPFFVWA